MSTPIVTDDVVTMQMRDSDWRALIRAIGKRNIIPVLGPDMMRVKVGDRYVAYDHLVAWELAKRQDITDVDLAASGVSLEEASLNDVVCACIKRDGDRCRYELHDEVWQIFSNGSVQPPESLKKLAEITDLSLFVTSTPDSLFEAAMRQVTPGVVARVYRRNETKEDIPVNAKTSRDVRYLYYLFGKADGSSDDFPICDEDLLRFVLKLQDSKYRPKMIFDELRENNLLLLGVNFSDWLARFFLWLAKDRENLTVEAARNLREYLADPKAGRDRPLVSFLQHFSQSTIVVGNQPEEFVTELHRRWKEQPNHHQPAADSAEMKPSAAMPRKAVFLSYSRSDAAAVKTLFVELTRNGVPAWYDAALQPGDEFGERLEYNIENCSLFIPLVSTGALAREQGYFRKEWKKAVERNEKFYGFGKGSIVPIVIDEDNSIMQQPGAYQGMPQQFKDLQMYFCPQGMPSADLVGSLKEYLGRLE